MTAKRLLLFILLFFLLAVPTTHAQTDLVAILEVLTPGVEVQTNNTSAWVGIRSETLINVGDRVRTTATGEGRITFFEDGTAIELTPNSEVLIKQFEGDDSRYNISLEVASGIITHQVTSLTDPGSSYEVITPGMSLAVRGTDFAVRVEADGRSALLTSGGSVAANNDDGEAEVETGFGVRAEVDQPLSDVVAATTFDQLDAALDGCTGSVSTAGDVRLYVRVGPSRELAQVGSIDPGAIDHFLGITADGEWYRIPFKGGFGWFTTTGLTVTVDETCPGLRQYEIAPVEDASLYTSLELSGDAIVLFGETNLRSGPGLEFEVIGRLNVGEVVSITGKDESGEWLQVRTADGRFGWIFANLLRLYIDLNLIDVIITEPTPEATAESSD